MLQKILCIHSVFLILTDATNFCLEVAAVNEQLFTVINITQQWY